MFFKSLQITLIVACLFAGRAYAAAFADTDYTRTEIISEQTGFVPGETAWFAVRQEVREGWHVFWVNPGSAGIPLDLDWDLPDDYAPGDILHPAPEYIPVGPLASYAHEGAPVFLVPVDVPESAAPGEVIDVAIDATWQVCEDICVPEDGRFEFSLPVLAAVETQANGTELFSRARASLPPKHEGVARFASAGLGYELMLDNWAETRAEEIFFFPAVEGLTDPAAAQAVSLREDGVAITLTPGWVERYENDTLEGVLSYRDENGARQALAISAGVDGPIVKPSDAPKLAAQSGNVIWFLALAFFGGIILNAMPCVFPIIFIKAASYMEGAREDSARTKQHGLLFTAGVLATFALMGGVLLVLRAGGEQLGWGFHLQSPLVVGLSAYVLFMVGLHLFGFFTVGETIAGAGDGLTRRGGGSGAFFTGALAVVVAAPCIGPLLTAPMGAALMQPAAIGMAIFLLMGLGLAAPYLLLSFIPALGKRLPKPGLWMTTVKQALAFPVFAAAAYFLWVLARQTGQTGLAVMLSGVILLALAAWFHEYGKRVSARAYWFRGASAVAAVLAVAPLMRLEPVKAAMSTPSAYGSLETVLYDAQSLADYRRNATPVFIDFTAAWCVTCQFNKMTVLKSDDVEDAFAASGAVLMVADWTVRDPKITEALESYGASGVPLYVYYPANGAAEILPLPLSKRDLIALLENDA